MKKRETIKMSELPELMDCYEDIMPIGKTFDEYLLDEQSNETITTCTQDLTSEIYTICAYSLHEPTYKDIWVEQIENLLEEVSTNSNHKYNQYVHNMYLEYGEYFTQYLHDNISECIDFCFPPRSNPNTFTDKKHDKESLKTILDKKVNYLNELNKNLPQQRSPEWYEVRKNTLSASNLWKLLQTEASYQSLLREKCNPIDTTKHSNINMYSTLHWGQKYEPVSQLYYEHVYSTEIVEYGCIIHENYECIGASPDGLNCKRDNPRYGRLLEIKNIINREITGIPKKEYWIQMQMQMECCNIDECDFLECRFKEYPDEATFLQETKSDDLEGNLNITKDNQYKGVIMCFMDKEQHPHYEYMPFNVVSKTKCYEWQDKKMTEYEQKNMHWSFNSYWYLQEVSCILVERNQQWFYAVLPNILDFWNNVLLKRKELKESGSIFMEKPERNKKRKICNVTACKYTDTVKKIIHIDI